VDLLAITATARKKHRNKIKLRHIAVWATLLSLAQGSAFAAHKLLDYQGRVVLQRKQNQGWAPAEPVRRRLLAVVSQDRIEVDNDAWALVRCASRNKPLWTVKTGGPFPVSRGCGMEMVMRLAARAEGQPGGADASLPYLIEPRATAVEGTPVPVRWNAVTGVRGYQVWLLRQRDQRLLWGQRVENGSSTILPASVTLTPEESYLVVVEADNGTSSQLDVGATGQAFRRISPLEEKNLAREREEVTLQGRDPEATALLQADRFSQAELYASAIRRLEQHLNEHNSSVAVLLELGRLYGRVGLNQLAYQRFQRAGALAGSSADSQALLEAQAGSAEAKQRLQALQP
jgi:hypothetical protein